MKATGSKMAPSKGVLGYVALHSGLHLECSKSK